MTVLSPREQSGDTDLRYDHLFHGQETRGLTASQFSLFLEAWFKIGEISELKERERERERKRERDRQKSGLKLH